MAKRDYSEVNADWNVPPSFGPIAHLVGHATGASKNSAKLSVDDIEDIKKARAEKVRISVLAKKYGVSEGQISMVARGVAKNRVKNGA